MEYINNFLSSDKPLEIRISCLSGIEKALNRIADEMEKSNNQKGKHFKTEEN